jgi:hypothetical protein
MDAIRVQCEASATQRKRAAAPLDSRRRRAGGRNNVAQPQSTRPVQMMLNLHRSSTRSTVSTVCQQV